MNLMPLHSFVTSPDAVQRLGISGIRNIIKRCKGPFTGRVGGIEWRKRGTVSARGGASPLLWAAALYNLLILYVIHSFLKKAYSHEPESRCGASDSGVSLA